MGRGLIHTHTHTHTHIHVHLWGGFRGIRYLAAKLGTWIIPHFHGVYSYDVPRNTAISRPKMCKKKLHNRYDFLPVTGEKIELSNNSRGHPIACILPLDCLTSDFWIWGYPHCFEFPTYLRWRVCVSPKNSLYIRTHTTHTHTHTYTHAHTQTHTHIHTHTYIYTHTHTHTRARAWIDIFRDGEGYNGTNLSTTRTMHTPYPNTPIVYCITNEDKLLCLWCPRL